MGRSAAARRETNETDTPRRRPSGRPFAPGNPGKPRGAKTKITVAMLAAGREHFRDLVPEAKRLIITHLTKHMDTAPDCASCRHYVDVIHHYYFGKPKETLEIDIAAQRQELEQIAAEAGRPIEEIERDAERLGLSVMRRSA